MLSLVIVALSWLSTPATGQSVSCQCRCFPGDDCWPSKEEWSRLNTTMDGKLVATVPLAASCHDSSFGIEYDSAECSSLRESWTLPANQ